MNSGRGPVVEPGRSAAAVRQVIGGASSPVHGAERQVSTDQANLSVAVDERHLVKWFRDPIDHHDLAVIELLAVRGFEHMPGYLGAIECDGQVVAVVSEFVEGATDGWQWYVDDVLAWIDGSMALQPLVRTAARMGTITAALHTALGGGEPQSGSLAALQQRIAERRRVAVAETEGDARTRLLARLGQIDAALGGLDGLGDVTVQRVHGDLHAGQFLRAGNRLLVTDFDGDPMTASADRLELQPVEHDVAALLQTIDHVGRVAARRRPGADVSAFIDAGTRAATCAYRHDRALDDRLLFPLRVAQELHEYAYAATRLPVWGYVPDQATVALFPSEDDRR